MKKKAPPGVAVIRSIYLLNIIGYIFSVLLFYNRIYIWGALVDRWLAWCVRFALISLFLVIYMRLPRLKKDAWLVAIGINSFFVINYVLIMFEHNGFLHSLLMITGKDGLWAFSFSQLVLLFLHAVVNLGMLVYLIRQRSLFTQ
ncbi:MAG: hypothetical protein KBA46_04985 [Candidatus Omnitrophica bacterium]|nr:hypothetical protein [Candidatus Omnitrophota bacterium]